MPELELVLFPLLLELLLAMPNSINGWVESRPVGNEKLGEKLGTRRGAAVAPLLVNGEDENVGDNRAECGIEPTLENENGDNA